MAREYTPIDLTKGDAPNLAELAEEVHRTNRPRVIRRADEDLAVLMPAPKPKPAKKRRGQPFTAEDGLWQIVGSGHTAEPTDMATYKDDYLAEASLSELKRGI